MSEVFSSIFSEVKAFVYRCHNDDDYTMEVMEGAVQRLLGYRPQDVLGNAVVSYVGLTDPDDVDRVFGEVDTAIEEGRTWDMFYHIIHRDGHKVPVRERGNAIYVNGELTYLEGLVVEAHAEYDLTQEISALLAQTQEANKEIVVLTEKITASLKQLSMLSINAQIEAARSGDAGRGFSIVANEMKSLAAENTKWANIITERMTQIR